MKKGKIDNYLKAFVAVAITLAFVMPGSAAFANIGTFGVTFNSENTSKIENIIKNIEKVTTNDNSDGSDIENIIDFTTNDKRYTLEHIDSAMVVEETTTVAMPITGKTIYVDDDRPPGWYNATQVKTIQEGVNNATAGDTVYVYNGIYYEHVTVDKQVDLVGEDKENVIVDGSGVGTDFYVTANNASISNFTVTNASSRGIHVYYSSDNFIANCIVYNNPGYGLRFDGSSNNKLVNCRFYDNGKDGVYNYDSANEITDCDFYNNSRCGIWVYSSSNTEISNCNIYNNKNIGVNLFTSSNNKLRNNSIYNNTYDFRVYGTDLGQYFQDIDTSNTVNGKILCYLVEESNIEVSNFGCLGLISCDNITAKDSDIYGEILLMGTSNSTILNVTSQNSENDGIHGLNSPNTSIINYVSHDNIRYGIWLDFSENSNFENCTVYNSNYGIYLTSSPNSNLLNCVGYNNTWYGICLTSSPYGNLTNCVGYNNYYGIYVTSSSNCNLLNCVGYNNSNSGIRPWNSPYSNLTDCVAYNNENGIYIYTSSNDKITNCTSYDNDNGFYLYKSSNNNLINCVSYNNQYGIYIRTTSDSNLIYHNNFIGNGNNSYDECTNQWDDGTEGNYWDDYTGVDEDNNGIGDTPYNITGGSNQDRYPLMGPIPELISPANNSGTEDQTPTFDWTDAWHSWTYTLQVATDPGFADPSIVINQTGLVESEYTPLSDLPFDTYYWRVRTIFLGIITEWSETWIFFIALDVTPPTTPGLNEPADQSTLIITPTIFFDWTDSYDAYGIDYYTLQIATDVDFVNVVFDVTSGDSDYTLTLTTPDEYYWRVQAVDNNGLLSSWSDVWMFTRLADTNPPVVELLYPVGGEYLSGEVTILWDATDDFTPNVDLPITLEYRCGGPWQTLASDEENDGEYLWDTTGYPDGAAYKIKISTEDYWGNMGSDESYTTFTVDNTDPVTTAYLDPSTPDGENNWYTSDVHITLVATDETSGIDYTKYKIDDGAWEIYVVPLTVSDDGEHTVEYYSVDNAGNEETINEVAFKIDQTAPTIDLTVEKTGLMKWLLTATVSDETSGVAKVEFYLDGVLLGTVTESPYEWECTIKGTAQAIVYDNAGNEAISDPVPVSVSQNQIQSSSSTLVPVSKLVSVSKDTIQGQSISSALQRLFNLR